MAGRIGHSDQSANAGLGEGDLVILCEVLDQVRNKYYYLGLHIGLLSSEIDCIVEDASRSSRDCLREVLKARLKETTPLTWDIIIKALKSETVNEPRLAERIRQQYARGLDPSDGCYIQQSGIIPVLTKYKEYLQSYYNAKALAPADKYLPTLKAPYIKLAMIEGECYTSQRDEFTRQTLHGGVDQIIESKTAIKMEDLFAQDTKPVKFILVEGPPGIGKSTFAWEVCRKWNEIESLRAFNTVVLLRLRERWVLNATSPSDLFRYPSDQEFSRVIGREVADSHGHNLLLILDGFDEVSHNFHENSIIKGILCRELWPECTIILTTRPVAKSNLESICQPQVDKHIEIIGFAEEERVRYITEVFNEEPELQDKFLKYMFLIPHIKSMMYIPLNCAIIARVYRESQSSRYLTIPRTRTQLYKALSHCVLVRHVQDSYEYPSMLPAGLNKEDMESFKLFAKFAFDSYHTRNTKKITFFKEDIPEQFVHFGFMNECTEMYASEGVVKTFSFLHLSIQEYLAAWHVANSSSIEFQVAYHGLATLGRRTVYRGDNKEEEVCISNLKLSSVEPAIFLAGITGMKGQSQNDRNPWETYLSHDTRSCIQENKIFLRSLYESQNPALFSHYFTSEKRKEVILNAFVAPYDCYGLSYLITNCNEELILGVTLLNTNDTSHVEIFVKGLDDHCTCSTPTVKNLNLLLWSDSTKESDKFMFLISQPNFLKNVQRVSFTLKAKIVSAGLVCQFLQSLVNVKSLVISVDEPSSWEWLAALNSLIELQSLDINCTGELWGIPPTNFSVWPTKHLLRELIFDFELIQDKMFHFHTPIDDLVHIVLKSILGSKVINKLVLPNISRENMADVRDVLLNCPSLTTLDMKRTRLGYDGILYICSALRINNTLKHLVIHDDTQLPYRYFGKLGKFDFSTFVSQTIEPLPSKTTCTGFLLELNEILKENSSLQSISVNSGLFIPLSAGNEDERSYLSGYFYQWTGFGPLQQFNIGAVSSGMSPNLRRSFSLSDLKQPQKLLFWDRLFDTLGQQQVETNFKSFFAIRKAESLFSLMSFTAPDTDVMSAFSSLDSRLKDCLELSDLGQYVNRIKKTFNGVLKDISEGNAPNW